MFVQVGAQAVLPGGRRKGQRSRRAKSACHVARFLPSGFASSPAEAELRTVAHSGLAIIPEGAGIYPPTPARGSGPDPSPPLLLFPLPCHPPHLSFKKPADSTSQTQESDPCLPPALPPRSSHQRPAWTTAVASSLVSRSPLESSPPPTLAPEGSY